MTIDVTCQCGRVLHAPPSAAGKKGRCKACGASITIPPPVEDPDDDSALFALADPNQDNAGEPPSPDAFFAAIAEKTPEDVGPPPLPPIVVNPPQAQPSRNSDPTPDPKAPPEPWYYIFLVGYATWTMGLGLLACGGLFFVGLILLLSVLSANAPPDQATDPKTYVGLTLMGFGVAGIVPVLLATAPVLLAVDAARHIRAMRYSLHEQFPPPAGLP